MRDVNRTTRRRTDAASSAPLTVEREIRALQRLFGRAAEGSDEQLALIRALTAAHRRRVTFIDAPTMSRSFRPGRPGVPVNASSTLASTSSATSSVTARARRRGSRMILIDDSRGFLPPRSRAPRAPGRSGPRCGSTVSTLPTIIIRRARDSGLTKPDRVRRLSPAARLRRLGQEAHPVNDSMRRAGTR